MSPDVSSDEIPQSLLEEIRERIQDYFVPLLVISPGDRKVGAAGSGTLVELAGKHYILTAKHVWSEVKRWEEIGLVLTGEGVPLAIPRDRIVAKLVGAGSAAGEWGPDLALLELPPHLVGEVGARKSFLNLAREHSALSSHPPQLEKAVWAVIGLVGQSSEVGPPDNTGMALAKLRGEAFFGWSCTADSRDDYDYLTLTARTTLPGVPSSFAGVSGGGLWQITLGMKGSEIVWKGERRFRGVAFWQTPLPEDSIAIRCHGPRSIFEKAWNTWGLVAHGAGGDAREVH